MRSLVDNFDAAIQPYGGVSASASAAATAAAAAGTTSYLIITTEAIKAASTYFGAFADSKLGRNFSVELPAINFGLILFPDPMPGPGPYCSMQE